MKKILISVVAVASLFGYEGCGVDKKSALNALSQSIYVNVSNNFQKKEELNTGFFESFNKNIKSESSQSSNLTLKNVKYTTKNNQICASVDKKDVENSAKGDLNYLLAYNISQLPKTFKEKQDTIKTLLRKIKFVKAISQPTQNQIVKLNKLDKQLKDLSNVGQVVFNTNIPNVKIKIAGIDKTITPSTPIELPAGEYSYTITEGTKCPISSTFTIKAKQSLTINKTLKPFPIITFTSNQRDVNVKLEGKNVELNAPTMVKKCSGTAIWSMDFEDQHETGEVELSAGENKSVSQDFTPRLTMKKIKEKVDYYTKSQEVVISYAYGMTNNEDKKQWDKEKRIEVRKFNNYGIYKLGFGVLAGTQNSWTAKDMNELEVAISARIQIPSIADTNFHIYRMPLIPYIGVEGGWDFYKFIDTRNYDANDITSIFRGTVGMTFLLHKQFGFNVEYSHDFMEKKDNIFGAGIVLDF